MIISVGGREFVPFKCAGAYLGGYSVRWLYDYFETREDAPPRIYLSACRSGWYRTDLDNWLKKRKRASSKRGRAA